MFSLCSYSGFSNTFLNSGHS